MHATLFTTVFTALLATAHGQGIGNFVSEPRPVGGAYIPAGEAADASAAGVNVQAATVSNVILATSPLASTATVPTLPAGVSPSPVVLSGNLPTITTTPSTATATAVGRTFATNTVSRSVAGDANSLLNLAGASASAAAAAASAGVRSLNGTSASVTSSARSSTVTLAPATLTSTTTMCASCSATAATSPTRLPATSAAAGRVEAAGVAVLLSVLALAFSV